MKGVVGLIISDAPADKKPCLLLLFQRQVASEHSALQGKYHSISSLEGVLQLF